MHLSKHVACPTLFICLIGILGMVLAFQGWNTRTFNFDLIPFIDDAHAFIAYGSIPQKGTLTSFGSYTPPGITWFMVPGELIFRDPRLFELPGCALLYIGTLLGIFLLTRTHFGAATAYL